MLKSAAAATASRRIGCTMTVPCNVSVIAKLALRMHLLPSCDASCPGCTRPAAVDAPASSLPPSFLDEGSVSESAGALSQIFAGTGEPLNDEMMRLMSSSDGCSDSLGDLDIAASFAEALA